MKHFWIYYFVVLNVWSRMWTQKLFNVDVDKHCTGSRWSCLARCLSSQYVWINDYSFHIRNAWESIHNSPFSFLECIVGNNIVYDTKRIWTFRSSNKFHNSIFQFRNNIIYHSDLLIKKKTEIFKKTIKKSWKITKRKLRN